MDRALKMLFAAIIISLAVPAAHAADEFSPYVDSRGNISLPDDFRATMTHLGSWFVPAGDASGFHDVYANADAVSAHRAQGEFPDGAVLVKELRAHTGGAYTTGQDVSYANASLKQWFVMVRDRENRFPDNASWGNGWGWALFQPGKTGNVSNNHTVDCLGCHVPARETEWIYKEAYPTLQQ